MPSENMGTPGWPEGVPHWTTKTMMAHKLRRALKSKPPRSYATLLPSDFRRLTVSEGIAIPSAIRAAIVGTKDRLDPRPPYSFLCYDEPPHGDCEGGPMLVNILADCLGGDVHMEVPYAGFIPDIAVFARNASAPSYVIEVEDTAPASKPKLREMKRRGIEVFRLPANKENPRAIMEEPVFVEALVTSRCGQTLRKAIAELDRGWDTAAAPFIGIRFHPSGTQGYLIGEHDPDNGSWSIGEPEVRGLCRLDAAWNSVPHVTPIGRPSTISRDLFMAYIMWQKTRIIVAAQIREDGLADSPKGHIRLTQLETLIIQHIDDLLYMVRIPCF